MLTTYRATADAETRDRLADLFDTVYAHLVEHLDAEEERLLPIAARTLTPAEWEEMGEAGRSGTPRKELALSLGMYQYEGAPEAIAQMLSEAPPRCGGWSRSSHAGRSAGTHCGSTAPPPPDAVVSRTLRPGDGSRRRPA